MTSITCLLTFLAIRYPETESTPKHLDFNVIVYDYSICTRSVDLDMELPPVATALLTFSTVQPRLVAIVDSPGCVPKGTAFDSILHCPFKRHMLFRILAAKQTRKRSQEEEYWASFGRDHPLKILLVDDNAVNVKLTVRMLCLMGYQDVDVAANGVEAVGRALNTPYDLILMDITMPDLDGLEATRRIREHNKSVYICGFSGHEDVDWKEAGMNRFLLKPASMGRLFGVIEECQI